MAEKRPTLCVVAGPNGSGKTTTTEQLLANEWSANSLYINPDIIANLEFGGWNNANMCTRQFLDDWNKNEHKYEQTASVWGVVGVECQENGKSSPEEPMGLEKV